MINDFIFYFLALISIFSTIIIIFSTDPIKSAISMFSIFLSTAFIYLLIGLNFLAAIQIIIYAGAIMTLFIIALNTMSSFKGKISSFNFFIFPSFILTSILFYIFIKVIPDQKTLFTNNPLPDILTLANLLFVKYAFQFELLSLIILIAVVIAYSFAKKEVKNER